MIPAALLDTDTLSHLMRQDQSTRSHAIVYLAEHGQFTFSLVTRYEILRGLKVKRAAVQMHQQVFERFCAANNVYPLSLRGRRRRRISAFRVISPHQVSRW